jgi:hypothetical protein
MARQTGERVMSVLKFSIEKDDGEYHFTYEHGFEEGGGFRKTIDEALDVIKEIVEENIT